LLAFFAKLPPTVIGMEACGAAHYWARELRKVGSLLGAFAKASAAHRHDPGEAS